MRSSSPPPQSRERHLSRGENDLDVCIRYEYNEVVVGHEERRRGAAKGAAHQANRSYRPEDVVDALRDVWVLGTRRKLGDGHKRLYRKLRFRAKNHGVAWPGLATLANDLGSSERQIMRWIDDLEAFGVIRQVRRRRLSAVYEFLDHPIFLEVTNPISRSDISDLRSDSTDSKNCHFGCQEVTKPTRKSPQLIDSQCTSTPEKKAEKKEEKKEEAASEATDRESAPLASPLPPPKEESDAERDPIDEVRRWMASTAERMATNADLAESYLGYPDPAIAKRFLDACGGNLEAVQAACRTLGDRKLKARSWAWFVEAAKDPAPAKARATEAEPIPIRSEPAKPTCKCGGVYGWYPDEHFKAHLCTCPASKREGVRAEVARLNGNPNPQAVTKKPGVPSAAFTRAGSMLEGGLRRCAV